MVIGCRSCALRSRRRRRNKTVSANITEVRSFLRLVGYYRRFVERFAKISTLLTWITKELYIWNNECQRSFEVLKSKLMSASSLALVVMEKEFVIYGELVMPRKVDWIAYWCRVIAYTSRQLKEYEKNHPAHDLELAAMIFVLKFGRHYLYNKHCDIYTNHMMRCRR